MYSESLSKNPSNKRSLKEEIAFQKLRYKYLSAIIQVANQWLYSKKEAATGLEYISNRVPLEFHKDFKFGYFPSNMSLIYDFMDDLVKVLPQENPKNILEMTGVVEFKKYKPKLFYYNNPLLFPYYNAYNEPISIVGRTLHSEKDMKELNIVKYKNLPFHRNFHLYGLNLTRNNIIQKDYVIIIEGQVDMISSYVAGIDNCVALCGSKVGLNHILLLKRFTKNFWMFLDNDEAGEKGWKDIQTKSSKYDINVNRIIYPDQYKDPDQFVKSPEFSLRKLLKQAK